MDTAPWLGIFKDFGPFALVIFVVVWVMKSMVPRFHDTLEKQIAGGERMLTKQEESGANIIKGILDELRSSREAFSQALHAQQLSDSENTMRLYEAIERGNSYLLFLIARHGGGEIPQILKGLQKDPAEAKA